MTDLREMRDGQKTSLARRLRRELTDAERRLWYDLRGRRFAGVKFRRQVPVGPYVADFGCHEHRVIVEVDGSQHAENVRDAVRDAYLRAQGWTVLRFWNADVLRHRPDVLDRIAYAVGLYDHRAR